MSLGCAGCREPGALVPEENSPGSPLAEGAMPLHALADVDAEGARDEVAHARRLLVGTPSVSERSEAVSILEGLCARRSAEGCAALGDLYRVGTGVERDRTRARTLLTQACEEGASEGCVILGDMHRHGQGGPADQRSAFQRYREGCELGSADGCNRAGILVSEGSLTDEDLALEGGRDEQGGQALTGAAASDALALALFGEGCARGGWVGCAALVSREDVTPERLDHAHGGLVAGCESGIAEACTALGVWYRLSGGDPAPIRRAFSRGCNLGDLDGCVSAADYMLAGQGGPADPRSARQLLDAACRHELVEACLRMGGIYRDGESVEADRTRALGYYGVACSGGLDEACLAAEALRAQD